MKTIRLIPILLLAVLAGLPTGCGAPPAKQAEAKTVYTCPMHPQVRQDKPGNCPLCGMKLVPESSLGDKVGEHKMDDGHAHSDHDGHDHGAAPMNMAGTSSSPPVAAGKQEWTCSMHPQIRQDKPGNCPICGMSLVPVAGGATKKAGTGAGPVVQLSATQNTVAGIATTRASRVELVGQTEVFGEMAADANRATDYTWYYDGRVQKVLINFNETRVKKGQPILRVYSTAALTVQEEYLAALRERWMRTFYEREVLTTKIGVIGAQLKRIGFSKADLKKLADDKTFRSEFTIYAPRSGSLVKAPPQEGTAFHSADVLFSVADLSTLWFVADVYEKDLGLLELGRDIEIVTAALPGERIPGRLVYIDPVLDPKKRSVKARFAVDNAAGRLRPDLSGTGYLQVNLGRVLAVPETAVINTGTRNIVYVDLGDSAYEQHEVTVGQAGVTADSRTTGQWIEIKSGLKEGERVVTEGAFLIDAEAELQGLSSGEAGAGETGDQPKPRLHQH